LGKHKFAIEDQEYEVEVGTRQGTRVPVTVNGRAFDVELKSAAATMAIRSVRPAPGPAAGSVAPAPVAAPVAAPPPAATTASNGGGAGSIRAPMAGLVLAVKVKVGDAVEVGTEVLVLEAMKMENAIITDTAGTVSAIHVQAQQTVNQGDVMVEIG